MDKILFVSDVSRRLRKSPLTIRRWINRKVFFFQFVKMGKEWTTTESLLEEFIKNGNP